MNMSKLDKLKKSKQITVLEIKDTEEDASTQPQYVLAIEDEESIQNISEEIAELLGKRTNSFRDKFAEELSDALEYDGYSPAWEEHLYLKKEGETIESVLKEILVKLFVKGDELIINTRKFKYEMHHFPSGREEFAVWEAE